MDFNKQNLIIYHSKDLDGITSGYLLKTFLESKGLEFDLFGYDYADEIPQEIKVLSGKNIYMADVTFPIDLMVILSLVNDIKLFDHHETFKLKITDFIHKFNEYSKFEYHYDITKSACEIVYNYIKDNGFVSNFILDSVVDLLGNYDIFRDYEKDKNNWENKVMPFQYGMISKTSINIDLFPDFISFDDKLSDEDNISNICFLFDNILLNGHSIYRYLKNQNKALSSKSFVVIPTYGPLKGFKVLCLNSYFGSLSTVESIYNEAEHDIVLLFHFDGKKYNCSLRTTKEIHLGLIAQQFGGGGHRKASGFGIEDIKDAIS